MGRGIKGRLSVLLVGAHLALTLAGCSPSSDPTPSPEPTAVASPTAVDTPRWTPEQKAAIAAVNAYLEVWNSIGQNLPALSDTDVFRIYKVAGDPAAISQITDVWGWWRKNNWHLVGALSFDADSVTPADPDDSNQQYQVHGCVSAEGAFVADKDGNVVKGTEGTRGPNVYLVRQATDGTLLVVGDQEEGGTC